MWERHALHGVFAVHQMAQDYCSYLVYSVVTRYLTRTVSPIGSTQKFPCSTVGTSRCIR